MTDTYLEIDFYSSIDDESKFIEYNVEINSVHLDSFKRIQIGSAKFYLINVYRYPSWSDVIYSADSISGDLLFIIDSLTNMIEDESDFFGLLAVLDSLMIDEEYQGLGHG